MGDVLKSGSHKFPLGHDSVDWFVEEVIELETKMPFYFKNTKKDIILIEEDEEDFKNKTFCRFCEKKIKSDKIRDHCHLTSNYKGPAHSICNINVNQSKRNVIPFIFHTFSNYDCHMFLGRLVDKKMIKLNLILYLRRMKNTFQ